MHVVRRALSSTVAQPQSPTAPTASASPLRWAIGGWAFFIAENAVLSENRDTLRQVLAFGGTADIEGDVNYHRLYGTLSTLACTSIAYGYFRRCVAAPPLQWPLHASPPAARLALAFGLQALGIAGLAQQLPKLQVPVAAAPASTTPPTTVASDTAMSKTWAVRCPFDFKQPDLGDGVHGVERVSRHASLWAFASVCLGAACAVPSLPQAACLAMPTLVALIGGAHTDSRYRRGMGGTLPPEHDTMTSNVPFLAMLTGAQGEGAFSKLTIEAKALNAACGVGVAALWALRRLPR